MQGQFREEEIANKVEFASFLKKRSELIEAGSPEHVKSIVLLKTIFKEKPLSMQAAFTYKLAELYNACSQEIGTLQSFPKWETVQSKESCKKFAEYIVKDFQRCVDSGGALVKTLCTIAKMQSCSWMACRLQSKRTKRQNLPSKTQSPLVSTLVVAEWVCCSLTCACRVKIPQQW